MSYQMDGLNERLDEADGMTSAQVYAVVNIGGLVHIASIVISLLNTHYRLIVIEASGDATQICLLTPQP